MSPEVLGILLIVCMLFAIFVGFPISFTLIFLGVITSYSIHYTKLYDTPAVDQSGDLVVVHAN